MNWLPENRFLDGFRMVVGGCLLGAALFMLYAKSGWNDAVKDYDRAAAELNRLKRLNPFPNRESLRAMRENAGGYTADFANLKDKLKTRISPLLPMAPNEFQSRLRLATTAMNDRARARNIRLPDKFYFGFDEFSSALPPEATAPLLGQELTQIERILDILIESGVDELTAFRRKPLPEERRLAAAQPAPSTGRKTEQAGPIVPNSLLERSNVEAAFVSTPAAARQVLNRIAQAEEQFFIIRFLHVRNEKDKGPPRESPAIGPAGASSLLATPLNFIVGNERLATTATIEIVRFKF